MCEHKRAFACHLDIAALDVRNGRADTAVSRRVARMTESSAPPLDPDRWLRLKDHVADLEELPPARRGEALAALVLDADDRDWLARLVAPLLTADARLDAPHPAARAAADDGTLRCRPGDRVGRYRIEGLLGRGGMGEVYEAIDDNGERVALKLLRTGLAQSDYARFSENEQRALRRLDDPRIAKFIEAFVAPDVGACLVLECVDGEPLQAYCRSRRFGVDARLHLFVDICAAVASAHGQLVVHRDLKPGNVLVTPDGAVKLLDFGVSKLLDEEHAQTHTYGNLFTLDYAAPEQVLHEPVSTATDVYALGVLLYRLLTEQSPYAREGSLVKAVLEDPPQRIVAGVERARAAGAAPPPLHDDRDLDRIVARAMEKQPKQRYPSVRELAADVLAVLDGRPLVGGGGITYRAAKFVRRHRVLVGAAGIVVIAMVTATAVSLAAAARAEAQAHRAEVTSGFLLTVLDLTDTYSASNRGDVTLVDVLRRAVERARTELRDEPAVRADVLTQLSYALQHQGQSDIALQAAQEGYAIRVADPDTPPVQRSAAAQRVASLEIEAGDLDQADAHLRDALAQLAPNAGHERDLVRTYTSLGKLESMRGDAEASLRWYERIVPLRSSLPGDQRMDLAMDYNNLGTGHFNLAHYAEADVAYARGIALLHDTAGDTHPRMGYVQAARASALVHLGRFDEARQALVAADIAMGSDENKPGAVNTERTRAVLDYVVSDYDSALRRLQRVLPQTQRASPVNVPSTLLLRARIEIAHGDGIAAAATAQDAEQGYIDSGRSTHPLRWFAHGLAGVGLAMTGDTARGDARLAEAIAQRGADARAGSEQIELLLHMAAAHRRQGNAAAALASDRNAEHMQRATAWFGALGRAKIDAALTQDGFMLGAPQSVRADRDARLVQTLSVLQRSAPNDPQVAILEALQRQIPDTATLH